MNDRKAPRWHGVLCVLLLLALPAALLSDCLFGGRKFLPFDVAEYPPVATTLSNAQIADLRQGSNYDATEAPMWFVPEWRLGRAALARGEMPYWNPYARSGEPMTAHGHLGWFDPLHWPAFLFADPADGLLFLTGLMFALGGVLMFGLLRQLRLDHVPALFGAVAFMLSGTITANGHWYMRMEPLVLLPGLWWAALRVAAATGWARAWPATALALGVACTWLAGFPPFCLPVTLLLGLCGLVLVLVEVRRGGLRAAAVLAAWLGAAAALGLLLAAPQVLQMLDYYPLSARPLDPSLASISEHSYDPMGLLGYVFEDVFSHPTDRLMPDQKSALVWLLTSRSNWQTGAPLLPNYNFTEYAVFPGTLTLFFAVLAFCGRGRRWVWLLLLALVGAYVLAIGPVFARGLYTLPVLQTVPPQRFVGPLCALVAMLAAVGMQRLRGEGSPWPLRALAVLGIVGGAYCLGESTHGERPLAAAEDPWLEHIAEHFKPIAAELGTTPENVTPENAKALYFTGADGVDLVAESRNRLSINQWRGGLGLVLGGTFLLLLSLRRGPRRLGNDLAVVVLAITVVQLGQFGMALNRGKARTIPLDGPVHRFLQQQRDQYRDQGGFVVGRVHSLAAMPVGTLTGMGIRDLQYYTFPDAHSTAPFARLYRDNPKFLAKGLVPGALPDDARLELPWWDLVGVRFLLSPMQVDHGGARVGPHLVSSELDRESSLREFFVYERPHPLPRAFVVPTLRSVADDDAELDAALLPDLQPRAYALMTPDEVARLGAPLPPAPASAERKVHFLFESTKRLTLQVDAGAAGYLVLADTWLPGWTATVDGKPAPIARGNVYQRVMALPDQACRIEFRYQAPGFLTGLALAAAALLVLLALWWMAWRRGRRAAAPQA